MKSVVKSENSSRRKKTLIPEEFLMETLSGLALESRHKLVRHNVMNRIDKDLILLEFFSVIILIHVLKITREKRYFSSIRNKIVKY